MKSIGLIEQEGLTEAQQQALAEKRAQFEAREAGNASNDESGYPPGANLCKKCHTKAVIIMDGCATCLSCGDSKCG
jgi:hypothetical protein